MADSGLQRRRQLLVVCVAVIALLLLLSVFSIFDTSCRRRTDTFVRLDASTPATEVSQNVVCAPILSHFHSIVTL